MATSSDERPPAAPAAAKPAPVRRAGDDEQKSPAVQKSPAGSAAPAGATVRARSGLRAAASIPSSNPAQKPSFRPVAIVPVYNQPGRLAAVVNSIRQTNLPVILVDDGSNAETRELCDRLAAPGIKVIHRAQNGGKGAAVIQGFKAAGRAGFTHALQIDADGQHDLAALPAFLKIGMKHPNALVCGYPVYDASAPRARRVGRKLTNFWAAVNSLSLSFEDAMCGMRLYPLPPTLSVVENAHIGQRMEFDPEILVRLLWAGLRVKNIPVKVIYPADGISHFRGFADNMRISAMHAKLCVMMITRLPILLFSRAFGWAPECEKPEPAPAVKAARGAAGAKGAPSAAAGASAASSGAAARTRSAPARTPEEEERAGRAARAAALAAEEARKKLSGLERRPRA